MIRLFQISLLGGLLGFTGCQTEKATKPATPLPSSSRLIVPARPIPARAWKEEINSWRGTPYQWGGYTHSGIDCSGLVFQVYRSVAGVTLPRTSQQQYRYGLPVALKALKAGDLVFFAIGGPQVDHVGISLGGLQFAHASTAKGVIISSLQDRFYAGRFYGAKRILKSE